MKGVKHMKTVLCIIIALLALILYTKIISVLSMLEKKKEHIISETKLNNIDVQQESITLTNAYLALIIEVCRIEVSRHMASLKAINLKYDFLKLDDGKLGALNFNNMIPVTDNNYYLIDMDNPNKLNDIKYYNLLLDQLAWLNEHNLQVRKKSERLYNLYNNKKLNKTIFNRCCNFKLLEEKCMKYNKELTLV